MTDLGKERVNSRNGLIFSGARDRLAWLLCASTVIIMTRVQQRTIQALYFLSISLFLFLFPSVCSFVRLIIIRARRLTPQSCLDANESRALHRKWERASRVPKRSAAIIEIFRRLYHRQRRSHRFR